MNLPEEGFWIQGVNNPSVENLTYQELFFERCMINPVMCKLELENRCPGYTREDLKNPTIRKFCSCYLNEDQYVIERECDSICSKVDVVPYTVSNRVLRCQRDVCIIDNITLVSQDSTLGNITFNQVCNNCSSGSCLCIINDLNFENVSTLNINQNCSSMLCTSGGSEIDCASLTTDKTSMSYILVGVLAFIGIVLSVFALR